MPKIGNRGMYRASAKSQREDWMASFQFIVAKAKPELSGKIEWDTAAHLFNIGKTPAEAAAQYLSHR